MKLAILDLSKNKIGEIKMPSQFEEEIRPDLIQRDVLAIQSHNRQDYAADPLAGKRAAAKLSRRRKKYRGSYGIGISRVPRKIMTRRGTRMNWVGAFAPGTVGGRRAHPPKSVKIWDKKINEKERKKAIRSAITSTITKELVMQRGHIIPESYPFVIDGKFETLDKTKKVIEVLNKFGIAEELERTGTKQIRSGKGRSRGRKYKKMKSLLIVVSKNGKLGKAASNIPGIDIVEVRNLNTELLAPGAKPGRLTLWTNDAVQIIEKENLFR